MTSSKTFNRLLSMLLLVCMLLSFMPATAFADSSADATEAAAAESSEAVAEVEAQEEAAVEAVEEEPAEAPAETQAEVPVEEPAELPAEEPVELPAEEPAELPVEEPEELPVEEPAELPAEEPAELPVEEPAELPAEEPVELPAEEPAEAPAETQAEVPVEEPVEVLAEEPVDEPEEPVEEPEEPADTTWKMELPFTQGTLTENGASFADLTLNFSPADASIGRTIDAYWIGVSFIAPEAVTAENIDKTTFTMDGSNWLSFNASKDGQNADGRYYMYAWVPLTVESVKTLVAAQQEKSWTFRFAWDGNTDTAQTFVITASPENITLVKDGVNQIKVVDWEIVEYAGSFTVTFDSAGGSAVEAQSVPFNGTVTKPEDPSREHYLFQGWYTADGEAYDFAAPVKEDLTLTAQWKGEELRVVYTDGQGHILKSYVANYGDATPVYDGEVPTLEGYRFADREGEQSWSPAPEETVSRNTVYTAQWVKTFTLHFDGYENLDITVDEGETAKFSFVVGGLTQKYSLKDTADEQFLGWDTNPDVAHNQVSYAKYTNGVKDTNKGPFTVELKEDVTLYPIFGAKYVLTAMHNDGTEDFLNTNDAKPGTYARLMIGTRPTRSGYRLLGYSRNPDATEPDADLVKTNPNSTNYVYLYLEKDTTIYAVWEAQTYTLSYDLNGGSGEIPADYSFTLDTRKDIVLPAAEGYTKEGRIFLGWSYGTRISDITWNKDLTASNKKTFYEAGATIPADVLTAANKTVYAVWKYTGVTESIDLNGGTKGPSGYPKTVNYGTSWSLPLMTSSFFKTTTLPDGTEAKNLIRGWYVLNDGTVHPHGNSAAGANGKLTMNADTTIVALYEYTIITFMDGEEVLGTAVSHVDYSTPVYTFPNGDAVTPAELMDAPEKLHYVFKGWAAEEGGEVKYQAGDTLAVLSDTTLYAVYEDAPYTLSFDAAGGEGELPAVEHYSAGDVVEIPEVALTREHYSFTGWADAEGNVYQAGDSLTIPEGNVTLTAQWKGEDCTVIYTDGQGNMLAMLTAEYGSATPTIDNPTREGYRFDKWDPAFSETVSGDVLYTAQWIQQVTLHFDLNGGDSTRKTDLTMDIGTDYSLMYQHVDAAREGWQFLGWAFDAQAEEPDFAVYKVGVTTLTPQYGHVTMDSDKTLYAIWGVNHTLSYDGNAEGDSTLKNLPKPVSGTYVRGSSTKPSRTGYTFKGWSYTADGSEMTTDFTKSSFYRIDKDVTLYAIWEAIEYTVKFDLNGGSGTLPEDVVYTVATKADISLHAAEGYSKEGMIFLGWSYGTKISDIAWNKDLSASQKKNFYEAGAAIPAEALANANKTIYAVWKYTGVVESIDLNGGTRGPSGFPKTVNYGTSWSLPLMTVSCYKDIDASLTENGSAKNYIRGWYVLNDGTVHPHGNMAAGENGKITVTEDTTIMALYEYTLITFMDGEEVLGTAASRAEFSIPVYSFPESDAITPATLIEGPEKEGYTFVGWATEEGGEAVYKAGDTLAPLSDTVLYAVFEINQYTLSFDANGGDSAPEAVTVDYGTAVVLEEAARAKHDFLGWAAAADAEAPEYAAGDEYTVSGDGTLYAVWKHSAGWDLNDEGQWSYYDEDGNPVTGWLEDNGKTYYLDEEGIMQTGWQEIDGEKYWFYPGGSMKEGWKELDGSWYFFDEEGKMQTGWIEYQGYTYYADDEGVMQTGLTTVDGSVYLFEDADVSKLSYGSMKTGWQQLNGKWYYFAEDGVMATGWLQLNGKCHYFGNDGVMAAGWKQIDGKWYYFNASGSMVTGWKQIDGKWYYFNAGGSMKTGWLQYNGYWYYLQASGAMAADTTLTINGKSYSFDANGRMI